MMRCIFLRPALSASRGLVSPPTPVSVPWRSLSSSMPPAPRRRFQVPRENPRLRTHAVSIFHGDYSDDGTEDPFEEEEEEALRKEEEEEKLAQFYQTEAFEYEQKKKRWLKNARTPERQTVIDERGRSYGRGGRKTSRARVWIQPGLGEVVVNRRPLVDYFPRERDRDHLLGPFVATGTCGMFDVQAIVEGGGTSGQAGAIRHGLARALQHYNPEMRPPLKRLGYLTRDPRKVEPKKTGLVKARKAPQWVRR